MKIKLECEFESIEEMNEFLNSGQQKKSKNIDVGIAKNATVTVCHSRTKNIHEITANADILVAALGKPKYVKSHMVKEGAVVIDVGINRADDGKLVGDVDFDEVSKKASYITPVPGGVGPMTIAMLMHNVVKAAKNLK